MTGKGAEASKDRLCDLVVKAITMVTDEDGTVDIENIKVEKKTGGSIEDSEIIEGVLIDKERVHPTMPKTVTNAKILLLNAAVEFKKTEVDAEINITSPDQLQAFLDEEERMVRSIVDKIVKSGANVLFCQKGIDDIAQHYLAKAGIFATRRVKKSDMEKLAGTGATLVSSIDAINKDAAWQGRPRRRAQSLRRRDDLCREVQEPEGGLPDRTRRNRSRCR